MSEARISPEAAELVRQICGTDLNGGFIRDLCFTVWSICHNPTHEDGNADWGNDTLPTEILDVDPHSISWDAATETMARRINRRPHLALAICRSAGLA